MDLEHILILFAAGVGGGALSATIGGASLVSFPALIATGLPPLTATVCNLTASLPGVLAAAYAGRRDIPPLDKTFVAPLVMSFLGAAVGAVLLLVTPPRAFAVIVPLLLAFATIVFALSERISAWMRARAERRGHTLSLSITSLQLMLPVSLYGGYFGGGVGILLLAVMSLATGGDFRTANATKNLVGVFTNGAAAIVFLTQSAVVWPPTLVLMAGTITGGLLGARLARVLPREAARLLVLTAGSLLTVLFAWRYWF